MSSHRNIARYFAGSFSWLVIARVFDAFVKFLSIPLLIAHFGSDIYGILVLSLAVNAYMGLLDLGINTGAIKYFSQWIAEKKYALVQSVVRTSITFFTFVGLLNAAIMIMLAAFGSRLFNIEESQVWLLQKMFVALSVYSVIAWPTSIFNQILVADEKMQFIQYITIAKSILNLLLVFLTIKYDLQIVAYLSWYLVVNTILIIPYIVKARQRNLIRSILPGTDWKNFKPVFLYSVAIFAMGIFQFTATQSRPLILGAFNTDGPSILAEYRIIEVFPMFIISIGGMVLTILLPITSKLVQENNRDKILEVAYKGTSYTSILVSMLCFPIIINSKDILTLYVGENYSFLSSWLDLWIFTIIIYLHNSPVSSLVLATGKTKMLVYSAAIACVISLIINAILCKWFGVGSAVTGYFVYILIQMSFYYFYFNNKVLHLDSWKVFRAFALATALAVIACAPLYFIEFVGASPMLAIVLKSTIWTSVYLMILVLSRTLDLKVLYSLFRNA